MIDQHFQNALMSVNTQKRVWIKRISLLAIIIAAAFVGLVSAGHLQTMSTQSKLDDEALGKLAAFAACSSGQLPTVEWDRAQKSVSMFEYLFGQSRLAMAHYFLTIIDTRKCTGAQTARAQNHNRV
jgi:hypothetical protein